MNKIDTLADLKSERIRLTQKKLQLEFDIKNDIEALKESFAPAQVVTDSAAKMLVNKNHGLINSLVSVILDLVLKKGLLRNSGFILRLAIPFIAKNTANNFVSENKTKILGWVGDLILKAGNKKKNDIYDQTTVDINI